MGKMEVLEVDRFMSQLLEARNCRPSGKQDQLKEAEICALCYRSRDVFMEQPMLLELEVPLKICGDTHGQYSDLLRLFEYGGFPPEANYLFLGDYVDRGKQSLETICLLLVYKVKYPDNFFLLRAITSARPLTESTVSMMSASGGTASVYGKRSRTVSIAFP